MQDLKKGELVILTLVAVVMVGISSVAVIGFARRGEMVGVVLFMVALSAASIAIGVGIKESIQSVRAVEQPSSWLKGEIQRRGDEVVEAAREFVRKARAEACVAVMPDALAGVARKLCDATEDLDKAEDVANDED